MIYEKMHRYKINETHLYCCIPDFLWNSLLPSHAVQQLCRFLCHWLTSVGIMSEPGALFDDNTELFSMLQ